MSEVESLLLYRLEGGLLGTSAQGTVGMKEPLRNVSGLKLKYLFFSPGVDASLAGVGMTIVRCPLDNLALGNHDFYYNNNGYQGPLDVLEIAAVDAAGKVDVTAVEEHTMVFNKPIDSLQQVPLSVHKSDASLIWIPPGEFMLLIIGIQCKKSAEYESW